MKVYAVRFDDNVRWLDLYTSSKNLLVVISLEIQAALFCRSFRL